MHSLLHLLQRGVVTGGDVDELWGSLLGAFSASSGALTQSIGFNDQSSGRNIPRSWVATYASLRHTDPFAARLAVDPPGTPGLIAIDSPRGYRRSELWQSFQAAGFGDGLNARLYNPFVSDLFVILYREKGQRPFDDEDRALFKLLYPHLAGGLAARRAIAALSASADETLAAALAKVSGHVYLSLPGAAVTWSAGARDLWRRRLGVIDREGLRKAERMLLASAARFQNAVYGGRSQVVLPGIRLEWANVPPCVGESRRLLGLMLEEDAEPSAELSPAEAMLSPRQRAVARLAASGRSATEIADELRIKVSTVRGYLREIYAVLGVSSRAGLVAALSQR
ncbi:MAG: response regulator transcription factor [Myxococcota bacterium]|nr:LuxR C-terminal-related transcriptional regulator [Myxococcota bacterium]